jgi:hypothetical protein
MPPAMVAFYMNDAAFELPETRCVDHTLTHLDVTVSDGELVVLLVERTPCPPGRTLREIVDHHVAEASKRLRAYRVLFQREREIAGVPGLEAGVRWRNDDGDVYTRHAHIVVGGTWLMIAGEAPLADWAACDACLDEVLGSFRLRG